MVGGGARPVTIYNRIIFTKPRVACFFFFFHATAIHNLPCRLQRWMSMRTCEVVMGLKAWRGTCDTSKELNALFAAQEINMHQSLGVFLPKILCARMDKSTPRREIRGGKV